MDRFPRTPSSRPPAPEKEAHEEAMAFMHEHNMSPLENWEPHQPFLYVFGAHVHAGGHFYSMPPNLRPTIVRVDDPTILDLENPQYGDQGSVAEGVTMYRAATAGRVDYYAIDETTKQPILVRTSRSTKDSLENPYQVEQERLFAANDTLFPPSTHPLD